MSLRDQLDRAAASLVLTLAEGVGRVSAADRAHFFAMARGSALECAAVLDILQARAALPADRHREARGLLVRVVQMLSRLIDRQAGSRRGAAHPIRPLQTGVPAPNRRAAFT